MFVLDGTEGGRSCRVRAAVAVPRGPSVQEPGTYEPLPRGWASCPHSVRGTHSLSLYLGFTQMALQDCGWLCASQATRIGPSRTRMGPAGGLHGLVQGTTWATSAGLQAASAAGHEGWCWPRCALPAVSSRAMALSDLSAWLLLMVCLRLSVGVRTMTSGGVMCLGC